MNFRNEIEILGGLLKVAERICWGWERLGQVLRAEGILGKIGDCWGLSEEWVNLPGLLSGWSWVKPSMSVYGRLFWETDWE